MEPSWQKEKQEVLGRELNMQEYKPGSTPILPKLNNILLTAIRQEVARQVSCIPWKCGDDAYHSLRNHEKAVADYIKLSVPLHDPEFVIKALDCLVDRDTYFELSAMKPHDCRKYGEFSFRLGKEVQWLPYKVFWLMESLVLEVHGDDLTGCRENKPATLSDKAWMTKHSEAIDNKILVRFLLYYII